MSTHCLIGKILDDSGKCRVIYCHMDGGLENAGRKLNTYFKKESDVDKLLDLGNLSYLGEVPKSDPKMWNSYADWNDKTCRAYKDRGDKGEEAKIFNNVKDCLKENYEIFNYFYLDGKWYCIIKSSLSKGRSIIDLETGKNIEEKVECLMEEVRNYFDKEWVYDDNSEVIEVRWNGKTLKLGEKIGDEYVTGFNPDTNTVFLDEDPEVLGGADYSVEDVFDWKDEQLAKQESLTEAEEPVEVEEKEIIDQDPNEGLKVGDKVTIKGLGEDSPWEGLYGEVTWIDEEDFADDFQTITVRVNFPTADGEREVEQNFDRRNVVKSMGESLTESEMELNDIIKDSYYACTQKHLENKYPSIDDVWEDLENNYMNHKVVADLFELDTPEDGGKLYRIIEKAVRDLGVPYVTYGVNDNLVVVGESLTEDKTFFNKYKKELEQLYNIYVNEGTRVVSSEVIRNSLNNSLNELSSEDLMFIINHSDLPLKANYLRKDGSFRIEMPFNDFLKLSLEQNNYNFKVKHNEEEIGSFNSIDDALKAFKEESLKVKNDVINEGEEHYDSDGAYLYIRVPEDKKIGTVAELARSVNRRNMDYFYTHCSHYDGYASSVRGADAFNIIPKEWQEKMEKTVKEIESTNESLTEEKQVDKDGDVIIDTIEIPHEEYTSREDIIRINNELDEKAKAGKLLGLRKEKNMLMLAEPAINGIWTLFLNDKGGIIKITLW